MPYDIPNKLQTPRTLKEKKDTRTSKHTHGRLNLVTTSLLEMLITAKNIKEANKAKMEEP